VQDITLNNRRVAITATRTVPPSSQWTSRLSVTSVRSWADDAKFCGSAGRRFGEARKEAAQWTAATVATT
jgi:hypothetical protein